MPLNLPKCKVEMAEKMAKKWSRNGRKMQILRWMKREKWRRRPLKIPHRALENRINKQNFENRIFNFLP